LLPELNPVRQVPPKGGAQPLSCLALLLGGCINSLCGFLVALWQLWGIVVTNHAGVRDSARRKQYALTEEEVMNGTSSLGYSASAGPALDTKGQTQSEMGQVELTISQMSRLFSVSLRTLRFYEGRGLIQPRREGNTRFYRAADRACMDMILKGKKLGFTLTEIIALIGGIGANETPSG
jgi:hypothetical protein